MLGVWGVPRVAVSCYMLVLAHARSHDFSHCCLQQPDLKVEAPCWDTFSGHFLDTFWSGHGVIGGQNRILGAQNRAQNHARRSIHLTLRRLHPISMSCRGFSTGPGTAFWRPSGCFTVIYHGLFLDSGQEAPKSVQNWS